MNRREKAFAVLPTLLTLGNASCGFGAITYAANWTGSDPGTSMLIAACLIYLAMVFDALDGRAARWANQTSQFGAQLDSLCDAISFGAAPAFLMLQCSLSRGYHPRLLWLIGAVYVVCTVLRLARFNVETDDDDTHSHFSGLPSPAAAGTVASIPVMLFGLKRLEDPTNNAVWNQVSEWIEPAIVAVFPLMTVAVACLMVSRVRYVHVFNQLVRGRKNRQHLIYLVFALAVIFVLPQMSVPLLFGWYAFSSPIKAAWTEGIARLKRRSLPPSANLP